MASTNILTGYTYIPANVFLQMLPGLKCPVTWSKALASHGVAMQLQLQCHAIKNLTFAVII